VSARIVRTHPVMGTVASVHVHHVADLTVVDSAIEAMWVELDRLEDLFSTFRDSSEISRINRGELHLLEASQEVIAELAAQHLDRAGLRHWYLNVGGDIQTRGTSGDGSPWRIAIADPNSDDSRSIRAFVEVSGDAVATSGTAARGLHVWDGRTNEPSAELASMTVTGPNLTWADAFATTAFVMGLDGLEWVARFDGYRAVAITADGKLVSNETEWQPASERQASMA
jgi:thiamine biosynthesis lipoprotein